MEDGNTEYQPNLELGKDYWEEKVKLTVFLERRSEFLVKVAWWIIFLTVIALLLLLAFSGFVLWKRGCIRCFDYEKNLLHDGDPDRDSPP